MVSGGSGQPQLTVTVASMTQAAVTQVLQRSVVDTAAGHPDTIGGAAVGPDPRSTGTALKVTREVLVMAGAKGGDGGRDAPEDCDCATAPLLAARLGCQFLFPG